MPRGSSYCQVCTMDGRFSVGIQTTVLHISAYFGVWLHTSHDRGVNGLALLSRKEHVKSQYNVLVTQSVTSGNWPLTVEGKHSAREHQSPGTSLVK